MSTNKIKAELMTITPVWAARMLETKNIGNRSMKLSHVDSLAREITAGRWKVNGDTICFNGDRLIDGQHRLAAIVKAGVAVQSLVVEGVASDVFETKDTGVRRSAGDTLGCHGETWANRLAAMLALVDRYCTGRMALSFSYSNSEVVLLLAKYPGARDAIHSLAKKGYLAPPSVIDACHYLFGRKDPQLAASFMDKILRGSGISEGDPEYVLREKLVLNSLSTAKLSKNQIMAMFIKAWNAAREGRKISLLRWVEKGDHAEPFPIIR